MKKMKSLGAIVVLPILSASLYCCLVTPTYESDSVLVLANPSKDGGGLTSILSGGTGDYSTGSFLLASYVSSYSEYKSLDNTLGMAALMKNADVLYRLGGVFDGFRSGDWGKYHAYKRMVGIKTDDTSYISTLHTYAYTAADAVSMQKRILADTVSHINALNAQQDADFTRLASQNVAHYRMALLEDDKALSDFRARTGFYNPTLDYSNVLNETSSLYAHNVDIMAQYKSLVAGTPNNPVADQYRRQMSVVQAAIDHVQQSGRNIQDSAHDYDVLSNRREMDAKLLMKSEETLQTEMLKAAQNHYYLHLISAPSESPSPEYPYSLTIMLTVIAASLVIFWLYNL